jgi:hypothetical protein
MDEDHRDHPELEQETAPRKRARRIAYKLNSIGGVISELGAVYRAFTRGDYRAEGTNAQGAAVRDSSRGRGRRTRQTSR